jgi:hypothetical protein
VRPVSARRLIPECCRHPAIEAGTKIFLDMGQALQTEIKINSRSIFCEVIESELKSEYVSMAEIENPKKRWKLRMVTFLLRLPQNSLDKDCGKELWIRIQQQYGRIKRKYAQDEGVNQDLIIHISYRYNKVNFECEFNEFSKPEIDALCSANKLAEIYPKAKEIRIIRQGPTILRFHGPSQKNSHRNWVRKFVGRASEKT